MDNKLEQNNIPRIECLILRILKNNYADIYSRSMSPSEILESMVDDMSVDTIKKHLRVLREKGFVEEGAKISRSKGYILTNKGSELLPAPIKVEEN